MRYGQLAVLVALVALILEVHSADAASGYKVTLLHPLSGYESSVVRDSLVGVQVGAGYPCCEEPRAHLWNGTAESAVDLHPAGFRWSYATTASASAQFGSGQIEGKVLQHALMWHGTAESVVDLHPPGFVHSAIRGASSDFQVGEGDLGDTRTNSHALLWNGTSTGVVDLNPPGFTQTGASAIEGATQVGSGRGPGTNDQMHALMWHGTADSVVDLHPAGRQSSIAFGTSGSTQVGSAADLIFREHAYMWHGTAASAVDLNPVGFPRSIAYDVAGDIQVGLATPDVVSLRARAYLWRGSAASAVDLHTFVVAQLGPHFDESYASTIAPNGEIAGAVINRSLGSIYYAAKWTPVPEPGTSAIVGMVALIAAGQRARLRVKLNREIVHVFGGQ